MFRFTIRELTAIALATAMAVAWFVEHRRFQVADDLSQYWRRRYDEREIERRDEIERKLEPWGLGIGETDHIGLIVYDKRKQDDLVDAFTPHPPKKQDRP